MSPDRVAAAVALWIRLYTEGLPQPVAHRRIEEIQADVHDQITHERSLGIAERRIARRLASRMVRGAAADVAWRAHAGRTARTHATKEHTMQTVPLARSAVRVSALVLTILAIPLIGMAASNDVDWSVADFVLAGTLLGLIGICVEIAIRRRGNPVFAGAVACLGVVAAVAGALDDAPGLVLLGVMMIAGGGAVARRRIQSTR